MTNQPPSEDECICPYTDPSTWYYHYGTPEPGSMQEWNPECPAHRPDNWCESCQENHVVEHRECTNHHAYAPYTDCSTCDGGGCGDCA